MVKVIRTFYHILRRFRDGRNASPKNWVLLQIMTRFRLVEMLTPPVYNKCIVLRTNDKENLRCQRIPLIIRTRHREERLTQVCFETQLPFAVDNTNVARADRARYIELARQYKFCDVGYYFQSKIHDCIARNERRPPEKQIAKVGLLGASKRLGLPRLDEEFDKLYYMQIDPDTKSFLIEEWEGAEI